MDPASAKLTYLELPAQGVQAAQSWVTSYCLRETGFGEAKARSFRTLPDLQMLVAKTT